MKNRTLEEERGHYCMHAQGSKSDKTIMEREKTPLGGREVRTCFTWAPAFCASHTETRPVTNPSFAPVQPARQEESTAARLFQVSAPFLTIFDVISDERLHHATPNAKPAPSAETPRSTCARRLGAPVPTARARALAVAKSP